jgi:hypothetical protein
VHQVLTFTRRHEGSPFSELTHVGAYLPGELKLLAKFAPIYLTKAEYQRRLAVLLAWYGIFFLRNAPRLADENFRSHHFSAIRDIAHAAELRDVLAGVRLQLRRMAETGRIRTRRA